MILDIAPTELLVLGTVALLVIPPKDLPRAMRIAGQWIGRARGMARTFRSGFDDMIRESEFQEMERKWKAENERIMREFPATPDQAALMAPYEAPESDPLPHAEEMAPAAEPVGAGDTAPAKPARKPRAKAATKPAAAKAPAKRSGAKAAPLKSDAARPAPRAKRTKS